jgi:glycolate oxidase
MKPGAPSQRGLAESAGSGSLSSLPFDVPYPNGLASLSGMLVGGLLLGVRPASERSRRLALSLAAHLISAGGLDDAAAASCAARLAVDPALLAESDRDQNVYLGRIFTRQLTRALPDLVFLPDETMEVVEALRWARATATPVTVRGAASAALGGAVANDGGLVLDLAHLDKADIDPAGEVCVVGAGARLRRVHCVLARRGLALPVYPSNLGATLAGWFATGGVGLNAFGPGQVLDIVRAADVVLPSGELVRFHSDGRLDVAARSSGDGRLDASARSSGHGHREVAPDQAEAWFAERALAPFGLADLAGSEGVLGVVTQLVVAVGRRPEIGAFLLGFADEAAALRAATFIAAKAGTSLPRPANLEMVSAAHRRHAALAAADDARQQWRRFPAALSTDSDMPWSSIRGPRDFGVTYVPAGDQPRLASAALLYVDFLEARAARRFAARLAELPGEPVVMADESVAFAAARFRPQRNKRLGPGLLAAEIELPAGETAAFLAGAARLARGAGVALEHEVYFLTGERTLVIAGYLTDHRSSSFLLDLALTPALLDLAVRRHGGRPYVLGRWQSSFAADKFGAAGLTRLGAIKATLDPRRLLGRGVLFGLELRGPLGWVVEHVYRPGVGLMGSAWRTPGLAAAVRLVRAVLRFVPGPGHGRGEPVRHDTGEPGRRNLPVLARSLHCVNCGECNAVCPVYDELALRLPQALVHHGETACARRRLSAGAGVLLDLCLRCGGCEQVCQAGIAHLEVYAALEELRPATPARESADSGSGDQGSRAAREAALAALRRSPRYRRAFLEVRPGEYLRRTPASLAGRVSFLVLRAENDAEAAATCRHCAACVAVCPSGANREFEDADVRLISTDQASCVGCGTCVEVCPANRDNGGQTLRVVEAPAADWLAALSEFGALSGSSA